MHEFGWKCRPVERAGTEAPPCRTAKAATVAAAASPEIATRTPVTSRTPRAKATGRGGTQPSSETTSTAAKKPGPKETKSSGKPMRPKGLTAARGGNADNLQMISGVGPKLEKTLHTLGFYHFDQIAAWNPDEVAWVDEHLRFKGRIERDEWIPQARLLAAGDLDKFSGLYGTGGLKDASGKTRAGSRTRKN